MTYSGLLMLVICAARRAADVRTARSHRGRRSCMPALVVAARADARTQRVDRRLRRRRRCCWSLKDFRLTGAAARHRRASCSRSRPERSTKRGDVDLRRAGSEQPAIASRCSRSARGSIKDRPLTGVGPNMVPRVYRRYRPTTPINARSIRTCTTCRCRLRPSAACRRSRSGSWFVDRALAVALVPALPHSSRTRCRAAAALAAVARDARRRDSSDTTSATPSS